jgi:hypothetical protein
MSMYAFNDRIVWNEPALDHLLNQPSGDVGRHLEVIALRVQAGAKAIVRRRTGRLSRSIYISHSRDFRGQYVQVGSNVRYALAVHEGTRPHLIRPQHGRVLQFREGGRFIYARLVHHPGNRARKYLTIPLARAVR